jgi:hypothetical protein
MLAFDDCHATVSMGLRAVEPPKQSLDRSAQLEATGPPR